MWASSLITVYDIIHTLCKSFYTRPKPASYSYKKLLVCYFMIKSANTQQAVCTNSTVYNWIIYSSYIAMCNVVVYHWVMSSQLYIQYLACLCIISLGLTNLFCLFVVVEQQLLICTCIGRWSSSVTSSLALSLVWSISHRQMGEAGGRWNLHWVSPHNVWLLHKL